MKYTINLVAVNPDFKESFQTFAADFAAAERHFNDRAGSMRNPKKIRVLSIQEQVLTLELSSEIELPAPAKALRLFTQYLLEYSAIQRYVYHGSLFRSVPNIEPGLTMPTGQKAEVEVMEILTKILIGDISYRSDYFYVLKTLLTCCCELDKSLQREYLNRVPELLMREMRLVKEMSNEKLKKGQ